MAGELILIVEDNDKNRKVVRDVLTFKGFTTIEAETGETEPTTREIPVIAMTASVMNEDRQRIMAAGFDAYPGKPIEVNDFLAAVAQTLEHRRSMKM